MEFYLVWTLWKHRFLNNSSVADFQRRLHKLFKLHKLHFSNLKYKDSKNSSNNNGSVLFDCCQLRFDEKNLPYPSTTPAQKPKKSYLYLIPPNSELTRRWLTVWSTPCFWLFFKTWWVTWIFQWNSSGCYVLKKVVTTWAKLVCSLSHVGMFWTEKVALVWSSQRRFSNTPKSIQQSVAARQLSSLCTAYTQYSTQLLVTTERLTEARLAWRSSTTECLLRGASFLLSALCTPYSGVQTSIFRVGAKQNRNWTGR